MTRAYQFDLPPALFDRICRYQARLQREMPGVEVTPSTALRLLLAHAAREAGVEGDRPEPRDRRALGAKVLRLPRRG